MNIFGIILFVGILFFLGYNIYQLIKDIKTKKNKTKSMKSESVSNKKKED